MDAGKNSLTTTGALPDRRKFLQILPDKLPVVLRRLLLPDLCLQPAREEGGLQCPAGFREDICFQFPQSDLPALEISALYLFIVLRNFHAFTEKCPPLRIIQSVVERIDQTGLAVASGVQRFTVPTDQFFADFPGVPFPGKTLRVFSVGYFIADKCANIPFHYTIFFV